MAVDDLQHQCAQCAVIDQASERQRAAIEIQGAIQKANESARNVLRDGLADYLHAHFCGRPRHHVHTPLVEQRAAW